MAWRATGLVLMGLLVAPGCRFGAPAERPRVVSREVARTTPSAGDRIAGGYDQPGPVLYNDVNVDVFERSPQVNVLKPEGPLPSEAGGAISPEIEQSVRNPSQLPQGTTSPAGTRPATRNVQTVAPGQFMTLGGVVAEVNGEPIYANKVLNVLNRPLAVRARELSEGDFRKAAREMIEKQIAEFIRAELEFAAAQRNLGDEDRRYVDALTMQWRNQRISDAGGSLQVAMQRSADEGEDFDQVLRDQYRTYMTIVFYQKRVNPRIQVSADDLRKYYAANLESKFTEFDEIKFRMIKIDPQNIGSRAAAADRAASILQRALGGESFTELAEQVNHDSRKGAVIGPIQRGAYALQKLEQSAWETDQGKVVDHVIDDGGSYYIIFVEEKKLGRVLPFEEEKVQSAIQSELRRQQFQAMREDVIKALQKNAIIRSDQKMVDIAVDMAMQNYPRWASAAE